MLPLCFIATASLAQGMDKKYRLDAPGDNDEELYTPKLYKIHDAQEIYILLENAPTSARPLAQRQELLSIPRKFGLGENGAKPVDNSPYLPKHFYAQPWMKKFKS